MSTPNPANGAVPIQLEGLTVTAPKKDAGKVRGMEDILNAIAQNPSTPVVFVKFVRDGFMENSREVHPLRFEYISSVEAADMLEITLADPEYYFIDHFLLTEDLKTEVQFMFGYAGGAGSPLLSDMDTLLFYRQRPFFPADGNVSTTITAYDKGILLTLPMAPKTFSKKEGFSINELVEMVVQEAKDLFGVDLKVEFEGSEFLGKHYRMTKSGTAMEFLYWLRDYAETGQSDAPVEIFVRGDTLYFRPARKDWTPIAAYTYFSPAHGSQLLSFEPQVDLRPARKEVKGVDQETGEPASADADNATGRDSPSLTSHRFAVLDGARTQINGASPGDVKGDVPTVRTQDYVYSLGEGESLAHVAEKFDTTPEAIIRASNLDPETLELRTGMTLTVPVPEDKKAINPEKYQTLAKKHWLMDEGRSATATASVIGHPRLRAGFPIVISNVGAKWEGLWYITEARHVYDQGGYTTELSLSRDGIPIGEGLELAGSTDVQNAAVQEVKDPTEQEKEWLQHRITVERGIRTEERTR